MTAAPELPEDGCTPCGPSPPARQLSLFFGIWAVVVFYDRAVRGTTDTWWSVAIVLCAGLVVMRPRAAGRVGLLSAVHLAWYVAGYTRRADVHWHVAALLHLSVLLALLLLGLRHRRAPTFAELHPAIAPVARWIFVIGVLAAGFAKLNTGFVDPATSCAVDLFRYQRTVLPYALLPDAPWSRALAIVVTLMAELGAPLLLLCRATRPAGFVLTFGFFLLIGTNPVGYLYEFAGLFVALALFFAGPDVVDQGLRTVALGVRATMAPLLPVLVHLRLVRMPLLLLGAVAAGVLAFGSGPLDAHVLRLYVCRVVFVVGLAGLSVVLIAGSRGRTSPRLPILPRPLLLLWVPAVFLAGEITPYIGLKHTPTMTMAANNALSTQFSNHLIVNPVPAWSFNRVVTIRHSSDRGLKAGFQMVWVAFASYLAAHPEATVRFEVDGKIETVTRVGDDPRFQRRSVLPALLRLGQEHYPVRTPRCGHPPPR